MCAFGGPLKFLQYSCLPIIIIIVTYTLLQYSCLPIIIIIVTSTLLQYSCLPIIIIIIIIVTSTLHNFETFLHLFCLLFI